MEIKTKFKTGDRLCFIDKGAIVYDNVKDITVYVYENGTHCVYYSMKESGLSRNEDYVMLAEETKKPIKCNKL